MSRSRHGSTQIAAILEPRAVDQNVEIAIAIEVGRLQPLAVGNGKTVVRPLFRRLLAKEEERGARCRLAQILLAADDIEIAVAVEVGDLATGAGLIRR